MAIMRLVHVSSIIIWVTVIAWIRAAYGQECDRFNTSRIPEAEPSSILEVDYFSCSDGEFLTSVDVWHFLDVGEVRWTCSDGDTSYYPEELDYYLDYSRATFDVGITTVETRFAAEYYDGSSDTHVFFGECYIGGYNISSSASTSGGGTFVLSGPFGTGDNYTEETWNSSCPGDSYATGVTWWTSETYNFVNGVQLECAKVTSTCYPPALENQDDDDTSTDTDIVVTSTGTDDDTSTGTDDDVTSTGTDDGVTSTGTDDDTSTGTDDGVTSTGTDDDLTSTGIDDGVTSTGTDDDSTSTGTDDTTGVIDSTDSNDTSSRTELGIVIAAAIGAAVTVVLVAVAIGLCFFRSRRQKPARGQETEASQAIEQGKVGAGPVPVVAPQILGPSATAHPPAYEDSPPAYEPPQAASYGPPPQYVSPGHAGVAY